MNIPQPQTPYNVSSTNRSIQGNEKLTPFAIRGGGEAYGALAGCRMGEAEHPGQLHLVRLSTHNRVC